LVQIFLTQLAIKQPDSIAIGLLTWKKVLQSVLQYFFSLSITIAIAIVFASIANNPEVS